MHLVLIKLFLLYYFRKVWRQAVTPAPPIQPTTPVSEEWDPGIVVARPHPIIRLVLFKELGDCDRPILFDSKSFERSKSNDLPGTEKVSFGVHRAKVFNH